MRVLVVEDEVRLAEALTQILREARYQADAVYDGEDGLCYARDGQYDAIVLDVMLPKRSGLDVARALRASKNHTPILMLTARDEVSDKVRGLDCGADDYMTKPFAPEELLARLRALLRRQGEVALEEMTFGDLTLSVSTYELSCGTRRVRLGAKEFDILRILMAGPRAVVSKEELLIKVWGLDADVDDNSVEAYVSFLRKKLHFLGSSALISAQRKVGYRLEAGA